MPHQLAISAPLPPPHGGVGVHIERLLPYLDRAGLDYFLYNTAGPREIPGRAVSVAAYKKRWFLRYLFFGREPSLFTHGAHWHVWAATWFLARVRGKKVVITLHGEQLRWAWESNGWFVRWLIARGFEAAARIIVVNTHIRDALDQIGDFAHKTLVAPAFIPPVWRTEDEGALSQEVKTFCAEHDPVILAVGAPVLLSDGADLYGIDMTIELVDQLRESYPRLGVVWFLTELLHSVPAYAEKMRQEVKRRGLTGHWLFSRPQDAFYTTYKLVDLVVRPTLSDGDALTVREGLHFGTPTIASDVVPRPEGTILFRTGDQKDLERVVRQTLENLDAERERVKAYRQDSAVQKEVALLQEVVAEACG